MNIMQNLKSAWAGMLTFLALVLFLGAANTEIMTEIGASLGVNASVKQILIVGDDTGIEATEHAVYDADGTASALSIGTASVTVAGRFTSGGGTVIITDDTTLTAASFGGTFMIATDAKTVTLPPTVIGAELRFVNIGADGNNIITISPNANDYIAGTITLAASVVDIGVTDDKDLINTKSTTITGDTATLVGDGAGGWYVTSSTGIWASE